LGWKRSRLRSRRFNLTIAGLPNIVLRGCQI